MIKLHAPSAYTRKLYIANISSILSFYICTPMRVYIWIVCDVTSPMCDILVLGGRQTWNIVIVCYVLFSPKKSKKVTMICLIDTHKDQKKNVSFAIFHWLDRQIYQATTSPNTTTVCDFIAISPELLFSNDIGHLSVSYRKIMFTRRTIWITLRSGAVSKCIILQTCIYAFQLSNRSVE